MNTNLIGDKQTFGIEYSMLMVDPSPPYGFCRIWLGGNFLGGLEGEVYLTSVFFNLKSVSSTKNSLFLEDSLYSLSETEIFDLMKKDKISEDSKYWFMYTEGFDLYNKYVYRENEILNFLWQLRLEVYEEFELQYISKQLFSSQVTIPLYEEVIEQFRIALREHYKF